MLKRGMKPIVGERTLSAACHCALLSITFEQSFAAPFRFQADLSGRGRLIADWNPALSVPAVLATNALADFKEGVGKQNLKRALMVHKKTLM